MDWQKVLNTVTSVAKSVFTLALSLVLIMTAVAGTFIVGLSIWWVARRVYAALGV